AFLQVFLHLSYSTVIRISRKMIVAQKTYPERDKTLLYIFADGSHSQDQHLFSHQGIGFGTYLGLYPVLSSLGSIQDMKFAQKHQESANGGFRDRGVVKTF